MVGYVAMRLVRICGPYRSTCAVAKCPNTAPMSFNQLQMLPEHRSLKTASEVRIMIAASTEKSCCKVIYLTRAPFVPSLIAFGFGDRRRFHGQIHGTSPAYESCVHERTPAHVVHIYSRLWIKHVVDTVDRQWQASINHC